MRDVERCNKWDGLFVDILGSISGLGFYLIKLKEIYSIISNCLRLNTISIDRNKARL